MIVRMLKMIVIMLKMIVKSDSIENDSDNDSIENSVCWCDSETSE